MRSHTIATCLVLLSASGCTSMKGAPTNTPSSGAQVAVPAASGSQSTQEPAPAPTPALAPPPTPPVSSVDDSGQRSASSVEHPAATSRPVKSATNSTPAKSKSTAGNQPIKEAAAGAAAPRAPAVPAQPSNKPAAPPTLNLADLEQRLRDTHAIGVFTKLSLKNQVDDLLSEFRTLYKGQNKHPSSELRQRYDLLLLKVLSLLQDSDPTLASAISSSREAIWGILADPDKFAEI
jgi:hypothetical protein